jgi:hypothetical protein
MNDLPTKFGSLTLVRKLGENSTSETYEGFQADGDEGRVLVRRVLPGLLTDPSGRQAIETRIRDLMGVKHPFLVPVSDLLTPEGECLMVEKWVEALPFSTIIAWCREQGVGVPHNVFLNLSTQICNGLEALHGRPGKASGNPNVLHMALRPSTLFVNLDGRIMLGGYGFTRSPALPTGEDSHIQPAWLAHLSPEQTERDQKLIPASDIFSLATILFELLTLQPLFQSETAMQTLHRLRRAEITTQLLGVKDVMPGLDKVLYRALSSSPRHRYQRAFVLREDLRGLMAGYSFANIADDTRRFLEPIVQAHPFPSPTPVRPAAQAVPAPGPVDGFDDKVATRIDPDPRSTAAYASQALAERAAREDARPEAPLGAPQPAPMPTSFPPPRDPSPAQPSSTAAYIAQAQGGPPAQAGPTLLPPEELPPATAAPPTPAAALPTPPADLPPVSPPPAQAQPQPVAVPLAQKPQPAPAAAPASRSDRLAAAAPPASSRSAQLASAAPPPGQPAPGPVAPPPQVGPGPVAPPPQVYDVAGPPIHASPPPVQDYEEDTGDWEPPKKRGGTMFLLMLLGLVLVIGCSGGVWAAWTYFGAAWMAARSDVAELEIEIPEQPELPEQPEPTVDAPSLDGIAAAAQDAPEQEPEVEEIEEPAQPDPEPPTQARDQPAYQPSSSERATTSRSTSTRTSGSSTRTSGSSTRSSSTSSSSASSGTTSRSSGSSTRSSGSSTRSSSASSSSYSSPSSSSSSYSSSSQGSTSSYEPAVADLSGTDPVETDPEDSNSLLERYSAQASTGSLGSSDIMVIEMVQPEDAAFTRSRLMLVMNAKAKGDAAGVKRYLDELSMRPENQYNPVVLAEYARYYVNRKDYQRALDKAVLAERHWARLPPELVFTKKAEIFEVEAASYQGLFYHSEDNLDLLEKSIRQWQKYREHVMTESRTDLQARANREIEKLENIRERLQ